MSIGGPHEVLPSHGGSPRHEMAERSGPWPEDARVFERDAL